MAKRKIIKIDDDKCNGCRNCIPNCPEGALQVIDDKARVISDLFCDGLGACIGHCPLGAISIEEREAEPYNEKSVMENIVKAGDNTIKAHLKHLKEHGEEEYFKQAVEVLKKKKIDVPDIEEQEERLPCGCPGSKVMDLRDDACCASEDRDGKSPSHLRQWPVQITLVPPNAPFLKNSDLLIAADCVPFAYPDFHKDFLKGKTLLVGCPKLDDLSRYAEKIAQILKNNSPKSVTYAHMEVPCCYGFVDVIKSAIAASGRKIPFKDITVGIKGDIIEG
ncbi:MAG: 4Fe-4S binding protein [Elusimicrobiota bacterium]